MNGPQGGEWETLRALLPIDPVVYVDIGAGEPEECSNTYGFYQAGGRGLLIDPRPEVWPLLEEKRPRDLLAKVAAWDNSTVKQMRMAGGCSSLRRDWPISKRAPMVTVRCEKTQDIIDRYADVRTLCQLCSVDTEGTESRVLSGIDFDVFRPDVFIVEYITFDPNGPGKDLSSEWKHILLDAGYQEITRSWINIIYGLSHIVDRWNHIKDSVNHPNATYAP